MSSSWGNWARSIIYSHEHSTTALSVLPIFMLSFHFYGYICSHPTTAWKIMKSWAGQSCCYSCLIVLCHLKTYNLNDVACYVNKKVDVSHFVLFLQGCSNWNFYPFSSHTPVTPTFMYIYMYILCSSCPSAHLSDRGCFADRGLQSCWRIRDSLGSVLTVIPYCTTGSDFVGCFSGHIIILTKNSAAQGIVRGHPAQGRYLLFFCFFTLIP